MSFKVYIFLKNNWQLSLRAAGGGFPQGFGQKSPTGFGGGSEVSSHSAALRLRKVRWSVLPLHQRWGDGRAQEAGTSHPSLHNMKSSLHPWRWPE